MFYYFYKMLQLDLFGLFINKSFEEKNAAEDEAEFTETRRDTQADANEKTASSLVELAEATLGAKTFKDKKEIIEKSKDIPAKQSEEKLEISFLPNTTTTQNTAEAAHIEKIEISIDLVDNKLNIEEKVIIQKPEELPEPELDEEAFFENDTIKAEVENEMVAAPAITEKTKKEHKKRGRKSLQASEAEADLIEVPEDDVLFQKQYYPISEVARWFRVNNSLLRFWENEFDVLKPKKNRKGDRLFRPEDVKNIQLIYHLLRQRKYTIEGAKEYIKTHRKEADIQLQLANTLQKFKSFLLDLKANL